jgi:DNA polymerase III epsilon subunit-like protein
MKDYSQVPFIKVPNYTNQLTFDCETSSLNPRKAGIVSICVMSHDYLGKELGKFYSLTNPGSVEYNDEALAINHISLDEIKQAPPISEVLLDFLEFMEKFHRTEANTDKSGKVWTTARTLAVGHNMPFDEAFIRAAIDKNFPESEPFQARLDKVLRNRWDTQQHGPIYDKQSTLAGALKRHGIINENPHTALGDVQATARLYLQQAGMQRYVHNKLIEAKEEKPRYFAASKIPIIKWFT